jgi:hypothetical protein
VCLVLGVGTSRYSGEIESVYLLRVFGTVGLCTSGNMYVILCF